MFHSSPLVGSAKSCKYKAPGEKSEGRMGVGKSHNRYVSTGQVGIGQDGKTLMGHSSMTINQSYS